MPTIFKRTLDERERKAGLNAGEAGKSWEETFASTPSTEKKMSQADFSGYKSKMKSAPPAELLKKHEEK